MAAASEPLFKNLNADDPQVTEIESFCVHCHANGITRLLLTRIPFYKDVVVMSFTCEHCGYQNNELQSGSPMGELGVRYVLIVETGDDLNRQVVKSDYANVKIPDVDFEIPPKTQNGEITTVEGIIDRAIRGLEQDQEARRLEHPETAEKIDSFVEKLSELKNLKAPFKLILEDVSGNSFIENPNAPKIDPNCTVNHFIRTKEQDHALGIYSNAEVENEQEEGLLDHKNDDKFTLEDLQGEVLSFPVNCNACNAPCQTNMKITNIPHFREVVIMATNCDVCGNRTNEVKSGSGTEPKGIHIEVDVSGKEDFSRDVLKSYTCSLMIPELELEVGPHALGGKFTTIEGLLVNVKEQLSNPMYTHMFGDSQEPDKKKRLKKFLKEFDKILQGEKKIAVILDDPAGNSYIQSLRDDGQPDEGLRIVHYERSFDQNEELGLNDMKTENYTEDN